MNNKCNLLYNIMFFSLFFSQVIDPRLYVARPEDVDINEEMDLSK